jgi:hypothetical protein
MKVWAGSFGLGMLLVVACGSSDDDSSKNSAQIVGVNDVAQACAITSAWTKTAEKACTDCRSISRAPKCDCLTLPYGGKCDEPQKAMNAEPSCDGVDGCISSCAKTDCACIEACTEGKACRKLAAARDGCVADVCDQYCK